MRAVATRLARCMGMIMPARGSARFRFRISRAFGARSAAPAGRCEMLAKTDTPRWIGAILSWPWLLPVARIALTSAFLIGGVQKLVDFPGAVAEQAHFGLQPAWLWAAAAIIVETRGFRTGDLRALGVVGRRRPRRADRSRHAHRQQFLDDDRTRSLHGVERILRAPGFDRRFRPGFGHGGAYAAPTILNGSTPFPRGFP